VSEKPNLFELFRTAPILFKDIESLAKQPSKHRNFQINKEKHNSHNAFVYGFLYICHVNKSL